MAREWLNGDAWRGGDDFCWIRLGISWILEGIIVTGVMELLSYSAWIGLYYHCYTSGNHHLSPNLSPKPTLSVVGTCWRANGLKGAMALLNAAGLRAIYWGRELCLRVCGSRRGRGFPHRRRREGRCDKLQEWVLWVLVTSLDLLNINASTN